MPTKSNNSNLNLEEFLNLKTLYYDKIDFNTIKVAWEFLRLYVKLPYVIHIVGTNGKGSTGRFLAHYLNTLEYKTLHYSSPHILKFNERIWINGEDASDELLNKAHEELQTILPLNIVEKLTYFEYTTLLALLLSSKMDYLVLEAGLGGEFDATNVVINDLSLITAIDLDHQSFLGNTVSKITTTKMRSCDNLMFINKQAHEEVYEIANEYNFHKAKEYDTSSLTQFPSYLHENLNLVLTALEHLKIPLHLEHFKTVQLFGRCQKIAPNITIDVGHNPLAARVIFKEFEQRKVKVSLVYNSLNDKDYKTVLTILKPIINEVLIIEVDDKRIVAQEVLFEVCEKLNLPVKVFENIEESKEYLVFGSFTVVEKFLRVMP
ncbi:MAG: bifunctional folylpolyglutamate synthase/dihydrofolate synthase [Arcobacteraceae bacterium]